MRLCTAATIDTFAVHRYDRDVMLYLGERSGSILMSEAEAIDFRNKFNAVLPAKSLEPSERLLRAVISQRAAYQAMCSAKTDYDQQESSDRHRSAAFEVDQAITAMQIALAPAERAA